MNISIHIDAESSAAELVALANFSNELARTRGPRVPVLTAPIDPAELDEGEYVAATPEQEAAIDAATGITPKRRRRTKEEIAAACATAAVTNAASHVDTDPHQTLVEEAAERATVAPGEAGNVQPAATQSVEGPAAATEPATASPSDPAKTYTEVEVQDLAGKVARTVGPEVVKGKIAELGAARIAEMTEEQRNLLGAFLTATLP